MQANSRVTAYLTRALTHEMNVVQQFLAQASLCELWGMEKQAETFRRDAGEELGHAGKLIRRMLSLGQVPNSTLLEPVRPGRDYREMLELDLRLEAEAVRLYDEAVHYSRRFQDTESAELFAALLQDEQEHLECLQRMLTTAS
ncbi:MAG: bacterioferritin [Gammaproteobacteria bacterium]